MVDALKNIGFEPVEESDFDHDFRELVVECDECGNTIITSHFWCGEFLPISMFCVRCMKHVAVHSHYKDRQ